MTGFTQNDIYLVLCMVAILWAGICIGLAEWLNERCRQAVEKRHRAALLAEIKKLCEERKGWPWER